MKNLLENSIPSAPTVDNSKMIVFLGAYEAAKKKWIEEQRVLTSNSSATENDKILLGHQQSDELYEMLKFFNVRDNKHYLVPITWGIENSHPRLQGLANIIVSQLNKNGLLKLFLKGDDVEFGIWKEGTLGIIKGLAVDTEEYNLCNQLCMSFVNNFIPKESEISALLKKALGKRVDESCRLMNHLFISDHFDEIWHEMRESQVHGKVQILAKMPKWRPGKDTVAAFNKRYDDYLCKRLGVQMVRKYLDTNPALRREFYMNYQMCIPPGYRKEAESFLNTLEDTGVEENPHRFLFNDNKKIYSNVNQGNIRKTVSSNVANNNVKFNILNKERATKFRQRGPQVNALDIESLTDKICSKMQDLILTAKVSTLITFCLLMFFIAPTGAQNNILNIYP
uniref:Sterile alpha and TIR motif-containing protein 1 n=1 Tax=Strongyloides venezuelensis TaxID=75913 RepID=A0A0K0FSE0_STRVS